MVIGKIDDELAIEQKIYNELSDYKYKLMVQLNIFLIEKSPRTNIIEWATKEECWKFVKNEFPIPDCTAISNEIASLNSIGERYSKEFVLNHEAANSLIKTINSEIW